MRDTGTQFNPDWYDPREVEQYKQVIQTLRTMWLSVPTKSGRPSKGPRFFAITMCDECRSVGMTSTKYPLKKRWMCKSCGGCALPVWADGPIPTEDEIWEQWAKQPKPPGGHGEGVLHHRPKAPDGKPHACQARGHGDFIVPPDDPRWWMKATGQSICKDCRDRWALQNPGVKITGGDPFGNNT